MAILKSFKWHPSEHKGCFIDQSLVLSVQAILLILHFNFLKMGKIRNVVFDLGGVLIDWNPRHLYRKIFSNESEMEWFLSEVCSPEWNLKQDGGRPFSEAIKELSVQYPELNEKIALYFDRWEEMLGGELQDTIKIVEELKSNGTPLFGLTNWSNETFPIAYAKYDSLKQLEGIIVSGDEKLLKPDHAIYRVLLNRFKISPLESVYIDDNKTNADAASELGFKSIHFTTAEKLREELRSLGLGV
jgi:2-haloacid dehalogenase